MRRSTKAAATLHRATRYPRLAENNERRPTAARISARATVRPAIRLDRPVLSLGLSMVHPPGITGSAASAAAILRRRRTRGAALRFAGGRRLGRDALRRPGVAATLIHSRPALRRSRTPC